MKISMIIFYFSVLIGIVVISFSKPEYNWDSLPYMALVLKKENVNRDSVHTMVYSLAKQSMPLIKFNSLVDSNNSYRRKLYEDSEAFENELGYYSIKPLYVEAISLFNKIGFPLPLATVVPSLLSFLLIGSLLYLWINKITNSELTPIVCLLIMLCPFLLSASRSSVPDLFNTFLLLSGVFLITEKYYDLSGIIVLCLAIAVRVDSVLFVLFIAIYLFALNRITAYHLIILGVACGLLIAIVVLSQPFRLENAFFIQSASDRISQNSQQSSIVLYFSGVVIGLQTSLLFSSVTLITFIFAVSVYLKRILLKSKWLDPVMLLTLLAQLHLVLRYILHPVIEDRLLITNYVISIVVLIKTVMDIAHRMTFESRKPTVV
jgi:hypothetical protein